MTDQATTTASERATILADEIAKACAKVRNGARLRDAILPILQREFASFAPPASPPPAAEPEAIRVPIYRTGGPSGRMPEPHQLVIVCGGVAVWTGSVWLSKIDDLRVLQWPVKWWSPLIVSDEPPTESAARAFARSAADAPAQQPEAKADGPGGELEGLDKLAEFIKQAIAESQRLTAHLPRPIAAISVSKAGLSLDVMLDTSKATYLDWIAGEGADIGLTRDQETNKVVGAHLPLYAKALVIGGEVLPTLRFDLETGAMLPGADEPATPTAAPSPPEPAEAGSELPPPGFREWLARTVDVH